MLQDYSRYGFQVPEGASVEDLKRLVSTPGPQAWVAFVALGRHPSERAFDALCNQIRSTDWRYRRCAVEALAEHSKGHVAADTICALLQDDSPYVVRTACTTAARLHLIAAHDAILSLVRSREAATRECALRALKVLWADEDFSEIFRVSRSDPEDAVRKEAAWTLREHVSPQTWRSLVEVWQYDDIPRHRVWACELVETYGEVTDRQQLRALLDDTDGHVRKAATRLALQREPRKYS